MPQCAIEIPEVYRCVTRPICAEIARKLMLKWGMDIQDVRLNYAGDTQALLTTNSGLQSEQRPNRLTTDKTITLNVNENYDPTGTPYVPLMRPEQPLIFSDDELKIFMFSTYKRHKVTIDVEARFGDRISAQIWRRDVATRMTTYDEMDQYNIDYTVNSPDVAIMALKTFHGLRENVAPLHEDFGDWLDRCLDSRYTASLNQSGTRSVFQITETQVGVVGYYEFGQDDIPPVESQDAGTTFTASFTYSFYYLRPECVVMGYPLSIHNQMVPPDYIVKDETYRVENYLRQYSRTDYNLQYFRYNAGKTPNEIIAKGIPVPYYDDWLLYKEFPGHQQVFRFHITVDPQDPTLVINLTQLGDWSLGPEVIDYLKEHHADLTTLNGALIFLNLYDWDKIIGLDKLDVDAELNVRTTEPMDPRKIYHFTISLCTKPCHLSRYAYVGSKRQFVNDHIRFFGTCKDRVSSPKYVEFAQLIAHHREV